MADSQALSSEDTPWAPIQLPETRSASPSSEGDETPWAPIDLSKLKTPAAHPEVHQAAQHAASAGHTRFQQAVAPSPAPEMSWGDALKSAGHNFLPSLAGVGKSMVDSVTHLPETVKAIGHIGEGAVSQAAGALGMAQDPVQKAHTEALVRALENHYATTYGSVKGFKKALATDPASMMMDASAFIPGIGEAGAAATGVKALGTAARLTDPVADALRVAKLPLKLANNPVTRSASSLATGVPKSLYEVASAIGKSDDPAVQAKFLQYMRGHGDPTEFLQSVRNGINEVKADHSASYLNNKGALAQTPVNFSNTRQALADARSRLNTGASSGWDKQRAAVDDADKWVSEVANAPNPTDRNITNADSLKQQLWNLKTENPTASSFLTPVWAAVKKDMVAVDPKYTNLMEDYQRGLDTVNTLEKTFGANGAKPSGYAALVKGLKAVKTSAGKNLLDTLAAKDKTIPAMLAGSAFNPIHAPGMQGVVENAGFMAAVPWALAAGHPLALGAFAGQAALQSPRLAGSAVFNAGKLAGADVSKLGAMAKAPYYAGRAEQQDQSSPQAADASDDTFAKMLQIESGNHQFKANGDTVESPKGAVGAAQVMPATGPEAAEAAGEAWDPARLRTDPEYNKRLGSAYFAKLLNHFKDPILAAAAYNAGPNAVTSALEHGDNWLAHLPEETRNYVAMLTGDDRAQRAAGGKVGHAHLVDRLMALAKKAKRDTNKTTEPFLNLPDAAVARALDIAQRAI